MYLRSPWHRGLEWLDKDPGGADRLPASGCDPAPLDAGLEKALMTLPAVQTHAAIPVAERQRLGLCESLLRLSVGIESACDIIADLEQALN